MSLVNVDLQCPYCGEQFDFELEENCSEDDVLDECPRCGHAVDIRLVLDPEGRVVGAEIHRDDGDTDA